MGESKEYITSIEEGGTVNISEEVIAVIAAATMLDVSGVCIPGCCKTAGGSQTADKKRLARAVRLSFSTPPSGTVAIECNILVRYGHTIIDVASAVQSAVKETIEAVTGLTVSKVDVNVYGISFKD
jgi:uncharacterized alkaline shock family protein YloU